MQHRAISDFLNSLLVEEGLEDFVVVNHNVFIVGIEIDLQVQSVMCVEFCVKMSRPSASESGCCKGRPLADKRRHRWPSTQAP